MVNFDIRKFKTVLHYIIKKCGHQDNVGKTVLYKLMYFSDFDFYELFESKMTGEIYKRLPRGPGPEHFDSAIKELEDEGKIRHVKIDFNDGFQNRYSSIEEPIIDILTEKEMEVIDNVLNRCSRMNATKISDYSHEDLPWQATEMFEPIDYELVFYRTPEFSVREYEEET